VKKPISQNEARRLRKRVVELESILEAQRSRWSSEWPGSVVLHRMDPGIETKAIVRTARALSHAVVVSIKDDQLTFWGVKP
jgi:hypothetical protein